MQDTFIRTLIIDKTKESIHKYMTSRAAQECRPYGTFPLYIRFMQYSSIFKNSNTLLRAIASLSYDWEPFRQRKKDHSLTSDFNICYNIVDIMICLFSGLEMEIGFFTFPDENCLISIYDSESDKVIKVNMTRLHHRLVLAIAHDPKHRIKVSRYGLNFFNRMATVEAPKVFVLRHGDGNPALSFEFQELDPNPAHFMTKTERYHENRNLV
jgi:hypothetical protein